MASRRGLSVLSGISRGMNQAAQNIWAIQQASNKLSRDKELFDLKKKEMNLQMKKLELDPNMDPDYVQLQKDLMKNKLQSGELSLKTAELTNRKTELANREKMNRLAAAGNALAIEEMAEPYVQQNVANIMGQEVLLGDIQGGPMIAKQKARKEATEFVESYVDDDQQPKKSAPITQSKAMSVAMRLASKRAYDEAIAKGMKPAQAVDAKYDRAMVMEEYKNVLRDLGQEPPESLDEFYDEEQEMLIEENVRAYGRSREEVIEALKLKGYL